MSAQNEATGPPSRGTASGSFGEALAGLRHAQKPGAGVPAYTRWINRRLARFAAAAAYSIGWGPNAVTVASAVSSLGGIILLIAAPAGLVQGIAVAVFLAIGYLLDSADGQVARLTGKGSPAGEWLDHVVDAVRTPMIHLAVLIGFWRNTGLPDWVMLLPLVYCMISFGQFMSQILSEKLAGPDPVSADRRGVAQSIVLIPTDTGTLCWSFLLWGFAPGFVAVYGLLLVANFVHTGVSMRRKYRKLLSLRTAQVLAAG